MKLSEELVSEFVKATNDVGAKEEAPTVYGTIVEHLGGKYVQLDGSGEITPFETTVEVEPDQRVIVSIKNHSATVTGNITNPSASVVRVDELETTIEQTAEAIRLEAKNDIADLEASFEVTAETIRQEVKDGDSGLKSMIEQTATEIKQTVANQAGDISELKQTADGLASKVENIEDEFTQISQSANEVKITATDANGTLTTTIDANTWEAIYKTISGEPGSGFYFDFAKGQFVYDGTGIYRSEDGSAYIQIEDNGISLYAEDGTGGVARKVHVGFNSVANVAYPYVLLGAPENVGEAGIVKKFKNGLFIGNGSVINASGDFVPRAEYVGIFVNTEEGVTYVVNGTNVQNIYTGAAIAKFR